MLIIISFRDGSGFTRVKCANIKKDLKIPIKVYVNSRGFASEEEHWETGLDFCHSDKV